VEAFVVVPGLRVYVLDVWLKTSILTCLGLSAHDDIAPGGSVRADSVDRRLEVELCGSMTTEVAGEPW
jgi:hypothetical protein